MTILTMTVMMICTSGWLNCAVRGDASLLSTANADPLITLHVSLRSKRIHETIRRSRGRGRRSSSMMMMMTTMMMMIIIIIIIIRRRRRRRRFSSNHRGKYTEADKKLVHTSIWVFTLTANSAEVYMLPSWSVHVAQLKCTCCSAGVYTLLN